MNHVIPFQFHTHEVRTIMLNGDIRFVASDVAKALEYSEAKDMVRCIDDEDKGSAEVPTLGGTQKMIVINESGVYAATFRSRKPSAKAFRRWVTAEVLPSIRRTGGYTAPQVKPAPLTVPWVEHMALAEQAGELRDEVESLKAELLELYREKMPRHRIETKTVEKIPVAALELMLRYGIPRDEIAAVDTRSRVCLRQHIFLMRKNGILTDDVEVQDVH